ncbi:hypothetical protein THAOC_27446, partial [Thalassiosira oceanica]
MSLDSLLHSALGRGGADLKFIFVAEKEAWARRPRRQPLPPSSA